MYIYIFIIAFIFCPQVAIAKGFMKPKYAAIVVDVDTGRIIHSENASEPRHPASLTKIMTLYLAFNAIKSGKLHPMQKITISREAAKQPRSNLRLEEGTIITVRDAILGAIVKSGNDVTFALAEVLAKTEKRFVREMNRKVRELRMKDTVFYNSSGLPHPKQVTTAKDMAILAMAMLKHHQKFYHVFSKQAFLLGDQMLLSHNRVLAQYKWANGMKTGYTSASGYNIITTAVKDNIRLICVIMGCKTLSERDKAAIMLLEKSYAAIAANGIRDTGINDAQKPKNRYRRDPFSVISVANASTISTSGN